MNFYKDIFGYLGYATIAILFFLIFKIIFKKKQSENFMGLFEETDDTTEDSDDMDDPAVKKIEQNVTGIQDDTNKIIEHLNLVKYRTHWENLIIAMEDRIEAVSLQSLSVMASMLKNNPNDEKIIKVISRLNEFNKYKHTLKENMKYLDGLK